MRTDEVAFAIRDRSAFPQAGASVPSRDAQKKLVCRDILGFDDACAAASDFSIPAPDRITLLDPDASMAGWLAAWAVDVVQVRRTLTIRRAADGEEVTLVATLSSYGSRVETVLGVESVWASASGESFRSGVYMKAIIEAELARLESEIPPSP